MLIPIGIDEKFILIILIDINRLLLVEYKISNIYIFSIQEKKRKRNTRYIYLIQTTNRMIFCSQVERQKIYIFPF